MKTTIISLLAIAGLSLSQNLNAASVVNGSFEADDWSSGFGYQFDLETAGVAGWTALDPNVTGAYPWGINEVAFGVTPFGSQFVVLGSSGADAGTSIQQTLSGLTPGNVYELAFAISSEGYSEGGYFGNANVRVSILAGSTTPSADYAAPLSVFTYWDTWAMESYVFTADSSTVTFAFEDLAATDLGHDIGIDNVSISDFGGENPIPEPSTILGGLALGILALRRSLRRN